MFATRRRILQPKAKFIIRVRFLSLELNNTQISIPMYPSSAHKKMLTRQRHTRALLYVFTTAMPVHRKTAWLYFYIQQTTAPMSSSVENVSSPLLPSFVRLRVFFFLCLIRRRIVSFLIIAYKFIFSPFFSPPKPILRIYL